MRRPSSIGLVSALIVALLWTSPSSAQTSPATAPLRFRITLAKELGPASGRLMVLMTDSTRDQQTLPLGFLPGSPWVAAMEVSHLAPGGTIEFDPDRLAYPQPFSQAK